jgi:hypothetical protein
MADKTQIDPIEQDSLLLRLHDDLLLVQKRLGGLELIQTQLSVLERQINTLTILASRTFDAGLPSEAKAAERERAKELAADMAKKWEEQMNSTLKERAARGIPNDGDAVTEQDLADAAREFA